MQGCPFVFVKNIVYPNGNGSKQVLPTISTPRQMHF